MSVCDCYLARPSEQLVLEGYRNWSYGIIDQDYSYWQEAWNLYAVKLGARGGRLALDALTRFTKMLGTCANCPLNTSPVGCQHLCRDEVMILGLLAGLQHEEETTVTLCLDELVCGYRIADVRSRAEEFATILHSLGMVLMPVPARTIRAIITNGVSGDVVH